MTLRTFSYGGGVQSTAALVLAAQGKIDFSTFLFSNVGDDSEHPATLAYVRDVAMPYARANGIELVELHKVRRDGSIETVYGRVMRPEGRSQVIPVYLDKSGMPGNRSCTSNFKIDVLAKEQKRRGATVKNPAVVGIGISLDEFQRMRTDSGIPWQVLEYPLVEMRLTRQDCINIIERAGLPVPRKSSCFFCPYHRITEWQRLKREEPELFQKAVEMERKLNVFAATRGDAVWLSRKLRPLDQVVGDQLDMFDEIDDTCESGFCMT